MFSVKTIVIPAYMHVCTCVYIYIYIYIYIYKYTYIYIYNFSLLITAQFETTNGIYNTKCEESGIVVHGTIVWT
jgi:hypothetical protein